MARCWALVGTIAVMPPSRDADPPALNAGSAVLSLIGISALVFGIIEGPTSGWDDPSVVVALVGGVAALALFVAVELRAKAPMLDPRLFLLRGFGTGSLWISTQFSAAFGFFFIVMQYLQFVNGFSPLTAAAALLPMPLVLIPTARFAPRLADRFGFSRVGALGLTLIAAGFLVISALGPDLVYSQFAIGVVLFAMGMGMAGTPADHRNRVLAAGRQTGRRVGRQRHGARGGQRVRDRDPRQRAQQHVSRLDGGGGCRIAAAGRRCGKELDRVRPVRPHRTARSAPARPS